MKKLTKLFLAFTLLFGSTVTLKETKVEATEIQPYANVSTFNREIGTTVWVSVSDGNTTEYTNVRVYGTYTHNINGTSQYPTNIDMFVQLDSTKSHTGKDTLLAGNFKVELVDVEYSCASGKLVIKCYIGVQKGSTYKLNTKTISV